MSRVYAGAMRPGTREGETDDTRGRTGRYRAASGMLTSSEQSEGTESGGTAVVPYLCAASGPAVFVDVVSNLKERRGGEFALMNRRTGAVPEATRWRRVARLSRARLDGLMSIIFVVAHQVGLGLSFSVELNNVVDEARSQSLSSEA